MSDKKERIEELVKLLNQASDSYYNHDIEIMSNFEYDRLFDELAALEKETGIILDNSPVHKVYEAKSKLEKKEHEFPALSLDKTKSRAEIDEWRQGHAVVLSPKYDGCTIVCTYNGGGLESAVTRGDGYVGEDITHNARFFDGLPKTIPYNDKLIVRGEALMHQDEFERINALVPETEAKYKNPRNLASSTIRLLDSKESSERKITVYVFDVVYADKLTDSLYDNMKIVKSYGFSIADITRVNPGDDVIAAIDEYEKRVETALYPSDGLVFVFDSISYGKSLGMTGKYPRNGMAFKWADDTAETKIKEIEWSPSRTGLLNPVAVFEPVELEGTIVSRASLFNVSIAKEFRLGVGSRVNVFKANKIIPQVAETVESTGETYIPDECPLCHGKVEIRNNEGIETLYCCNPECPAKQVGKFVNFCSRENANIISLSEATLQKLIDIGAIRHLADIYKLEAYKDDIINMPGYGAKAYANLDDNINASRKIPFGKFVGSLGIPLVGHTLGKTIGINLGENAVEKFTDILRNGKSEELVTIEGVGDKCTGAMLDWYNKNGEEYSELLEVLTITDEAVSTGSSISGLTFVITGAVEHYPNRDALKNEITALGGKVSGSVSSKTDYLINNDITSTSGKNKKALELGVKIITEDEYIAMKSE